MAKLTKTQQEDRDERIAHLRGLLPVGSVVYTCLRHVAPSGMSKILTVHAILTDSDGKPWITDITSGVSRATGMRYTERGERGIKVNGCGFDPGFEIVHSLSYALHGAPNDPTASAELVKQGSKTGYTLRHERI